MAVLLLFCACTGLFFNIYKGPRKNRQTKDSSKTHIKETVTDYKRMLRTPFHVPGKCYTTKAL